MTKVNRWGVLLRGYGALGRGRLLVSVPLTEALFVSEVSGYGWIAVPYYSQTQREHVVLWGVLQRPAREQRISWSQGIHVLDVEMGTEK